MTEQETWLVIQDGNTFYCQIPGQECVDILTYPYPVSDSDMDGARDARQWFNSVARPDNVTVEWSI